MKPRPCAFIHRNEKSRDDEAERECRRGTASLESDGDKVDEKIGCSKGETGESDRRRCIKWIKHFPLLTAPRAQYGELSKARTKKNNQMTRKKEPTTEEGEGAEEKGQEEKLSEILSFSEKSGVGKRTGDQGG